MQEQHAKNAIQGVTSMRKAVLIIVVLAVLAAIAIGWMFNSSDSDTDKVVINQAAKTLLYLPLYIAQEKGFFEDEGIEVTIVTGGGDSQAFAAVLGGSAQFGQGDPMMVPISQQRGGSGKIVGTVVSRVAFWGVTIDPDMNPIKSSEEFRDKKVVTYPEPMTIFALQKRNALQGGLTLGQNTTIVQAQFGTELAPLFAKDADITMTIEPVVSQALAQGARIVYSFPEQYGEFALTGVMVDDKLISSDPALIQRLLNGYQRALTHAHQNPESAIAVAIGEFPDVDKDIIENAVLRMLEEKTLPKRLTVSRQGYQQAVSVRRDIGDLEKDVAFEDAVDNRFAEKAVKQYGPK